MLSKLKVFITGIEEKLSFKNAPTEDIFSCNFSECFLVDSPINIIGLIQNG